FSIFISSQNKINNTSDYQPHYDIQNFIFRMSEARRILGINIAHLPTDSAHDHSSHEHTDESEYAIFPQMHPDKSTESRDSNRWHKWHDPRPDYSKFAFFAQFKL